MNAATSEDVKADTTNKESDLPSATAVKKGYVLFNTVDDTYAGPV